MSIEMTKNNINWTMEDCQTTARAIKIAGKVLDHAAVGCILTAGAIVTTAIIHSSFRRYGRLIKTAGAIGAFIVTQSLANTEAGKCARSAELIADAYLDRMKEYYSAAEVTDNNDISVESTAADPKEDNSDE